jgi:hypothetical protein
MPFLSRPVVAAVTGVATTAYYATPDVLRSRRARGVAKVALSAVIVAAAVPEARRGGKAAADGPAIVEDTAEESAGTPGWRAALGSLSPARRAALAVVPAAFLAASVASTVAAERWVFRHGEARAAAGRRLPHTAPALAYGALAAALALLPPASDRDARV